MLVENNVPLQQYNTFGIVAKAHTLVRAHSVDDVRALIASPDLAGQPVFVLGGGSNIVITGDVKPLVLKMEIKGLRLAGETDRAWIVEAGAGEVWHEAVAWTIAQGYPGLENMALIPGTVGAAPVQNIGAYGVELQDRFDSLDAVDLATGKTFTLNAAQCAFSYRDSIFKHAPSAAGEYSDLPRGMGLAGRAVITHVRFRLPKQWKPDLGYADLERKMAESGITEPTPRQIFDWVCEIRRAKLPDPVVIGNAGSFFKNPMLPREQAELLSRQHPALPVFPGDEEGNRKLSAAWMIQACGWKGRREGDAGVSPDHALVLVNHGNASGAELLAFARRISASVLETFGVPIEPEPRLVGARW